MKKNINNVKKKNAKKIKQIVKNNSCICIFTSSNTCFNLIYIIISLYTVICIFIVIILIYIK